MEKIQNIWTKSAFTLINKVTFYGTKLLNFWHHQYWCSKKIGKVVSSFFKAFSKVALVCENWGLNSESSIFIYFSLFLKATIFVHIFLFFFFSHFLPNLGGYACVCMQIIVQLRFWQGLMALFMTQPKTQQKRK